MMSVYFGNLFSANMILTQSYHDRIFVRDILSVNGSVTNTSFYFYIKPCFNNDLKVKFIAPSDNFSVERKKHRLKNLLANCNRI